jgi:hypothetical protein
MVKQISQNSWFGWVSGLMAIASLTAFSLLRNQAPQAQAENWDQKSSEQVSYETRLFSRSIVHIVRIPATASATIAPVIVPNGLETVATLGKQENAIAVINGGFFDPNNQQTTSFVTQNGNIVLDPSTNSRLVDNSSLSSYMPQILNRSEFRVYQCDPDKGSWSQYAIAPHRQSPPLHCQIKHALGAGPALLPQFRGETEAFLDPQTGRDSIGSNTPNARSAVGITDEGTILLIMAAQRKDLTEPSGLSLTELANVMTSLGIVQGLNLDGGSSSSLYYNGNTHYGRIDADKNAIQRPVKSVLVVTGLSPRFLLP